MEFQLCPVCSGHAVPLDVVDFNKSCEESRGKYLPFSGVPVYYFMCNECGFCFSPEICKWSLDDFERYIYNAEYESLDPDYASIRPTGNAAALKAMFGVEGRGIKHLDYGGGDGLLSSLLTQSGWNSTSYDPFVNKDTAIEGLGTFGLITAFEVFEHVPDVQGLIANLHRLLDADGIVLFSTLVSDGQLSTNQRINWWYAAPRNGHISLFSRASLGVLGKSKGFNCGSFSEVFHTYWKTVPHWASHIYQSV